MYFLTMVTVWKAVKENMKMTINKGEEKKNGTRKRERRSSYRKLWQSTKQQKYCGG